MNSQACTMHLRHLTSSLLLLAARPALSQTAMELYTPAFGDCPADFSLVRLVNPSSQALSTEESVYTSARRENVLPSAWRAYLSNVVDTNVSLPSYVSSILNSTNSTDLPTLGIAASGGGYRAAFFGAGVLNALDGRNTSSVAVGTGGLLQAATYLSGLSGGSWLASSLSLSDFPTIQRLVFGDGESNSSTQNDNTVNGVWGGWNTEWLYHTLDPENSSDGGLAYQQQVVRDIDGKYNVGLPVSIVDVISRMVGRHFMNGTTQTNFLSNDSVHGAGILFSDIQNMSTFLSYEQPFPIVIADSWSKTENVSTRETRDNFSPLSNIIYEFNPYEMGSYDPTLSAFTPIQYLGTTNESVCVTGFEQASFVVASSADLYVMYNVTGEANFEASVAEPWLSLVNGSFDQPGVQLGVGLYPNPFYGINNDTFLDSQQTYLSLVDGGMNGEDVPLQPLLVRARALDAIIAIDANADINDYSAGGAMITSQNRTRLFGDAYPFPPVPTSKATYLAQNLTTRPTFLGCNETESPLLMYIANGGPPLGQPPLTNYSGDLYNETFAQAVLGQSFDIATQGIPAGPEKDGEWAACVACAVVDRVRERTGETRSGVCAVCFERYCWDGTETTL